MNQKAREQADDPATRAADRLIGLTRDLVAELHPELDTGSVTLDSTLDGDLGLDSLARMELLGRIEKGFSIALPEGIISEAERPRDLLRPILEASPGARAEQGPSHSVTRLDLDEADAAPHTAQTLVDVLDWHVGAHPNRPSIRLYSDDSDGEAITYGNLREGALAAACGLQRRGMAVGDAVAIMLPTGREYFIAFMGILMAGGVPVPIYPPARPSHLEDHLTRHRRILINCGARFLITVREAKRVARLLRAHVDTMQEVVTVDDLADSDRDYHAPVLEPGDLAFLQYTSGSTGDPKGVCLTHANLLANIRAIGADAKIDDTDVAISWLPLYHDMGLIGAWFVPMYFAAQLVVMSPLDFLARPARWLWAVHRFRGTVSAAPNFAYELCLKKLSDNELAGLDLSSWRIACNGAEPVDPGTVERFCERFAKHGFRHSTMFPVYGLAENSVAVSFPPLGRAPVFDRVQREPFTRKGQAIPTGEDDGTALQFVACGQPLQGHEVRIADSAGRELPERREGRIQFRGPSSTSGYYRNPEATKRLFDNGWLDSGDRGYIAGGDIYVTGRNKDIIIRAGQNIYPQELEAAVGNIEGVRKGNVAVFASRDENVATEKLVVLAETRESDASRLDAIRSEINTVASDLLGTPPEEIVLAPPGSVPKTSSGKIRRATSRELYERGRVGRGGHAVWLQVVRLAVSGVLPEIRRFLSTLVGTVYAGYAFTAYGLTCGLAWLPVLVLPVHSWRWAVFRAASRSIMFLTGQRLSVEGLDNLPRRGPCIFVANHASYIDSYCLPAALPVSFSFVAKGELQNNLLIRVFLRRLRIQFVERFDKQRGIEDARRIARVALAGRSVLFYPEGGTARVPGLRPFHLGAFIVAAETGCPVVPVLLRGTRSVFRTGAWFPRPGSVTVQVGDPIDPASVARDPDGEVWQTAVKLRDRAREIILRGCGEPDLMYDKSHL